MYGSMARGDYHEDSDVNLLVISDNIPLRFMDRSSLLDKFTPVKLPAEVLAYTGTEFDSMIENRHPTALSALEEGRVLCDDGYVKQAYQKYLKMRSRTGLKRIDIGWVAEKLVPSSLKT
jgi:predicted nucleotidyltransferase